MNSKPKPAIGAFRPGGVTRTWPDLDAIAELLAPTMAGTREHALKLQAHSCFLTVPGQGVPRLQGHALQIHSRGFTPKGFLRSGVAANAGLCWTVVRGGVAGHFGRGHRAGPLVLELRSGLFREPSGLPCGPCRGVLAPLDGPAAGDARPRDRPAGHRRKFRLDALAAFFLVVVNLGGALASLYALGYGRHEQSPPRVLPFYPGLSRRHESRRAGGRCLQLPGRLGVHVAVVLGAGAGEPSRRRRTRAPATSIS